MPKLVENGVCSNGLGWNLQAHHGQKKGDNVEAFKCACDAQKGLYAYLKLS